MSWEYQKDCIDSSWSSSGEKYGSEPEIQEHEDNWKKYSSQRIKRKSGRQELYASFAEKNGESEKYQKAKWVE